MLTTARLVRVCSGFHPGGTGESRPTGTVVRVTQPSSVDSIRPYPWLQRHPVLVLTVATPPSAALAALVPALRAARLRVRVRPDGTVVAKDWSALALNLAQVVTAPFAGSFDVARTSSATVTATAPTPTTTALEIRVRDESVRGFARNLARALDAYRAELTARGIDVTTTGWDAARQTEQ